MFAKRLIFEVLQAGYLSEKISQYTECRQGYLVSHYLVVIAVEILAEAFPYLQRNLKVSQYANNTSLYLDSSEESLWESMCILKEFENVSGLKINIEKTKVVKSEEWRDSRKHFALN